jgi:hypothetical protein
VSAGPCPAPTGRSSTSSEARHADHAQPPAADERDRPPHISRADRRLGPLRDDPDASVAVLTGAGPDAFCAGADLKAAAAALTGAEEPLVAWTRWRSRPTTEASATASSAPPAGPISTSRSSRPSTGRICGGPRVGLLRRHPRRRRARELRRHLPPLEHRPRRRGHAAPAPYSRHGPSDGADHLRACDRRAQGGSGS